MGYGDFISILSNDKKPQSEADLCWKSESHSHKILHGKNRKLGTSMLVQLARSTRWSLGRAPTWEGLWTTHSSSTYHRKESGWPGMCGAHRGLGTEWHVPMDRSFKGERGLNTHQFFKMCGRMPKGTQLQRNDACEHQNWHSEPPASKVPATKLSLNAEDRLPPQIQL